MNENTEITADGRIMVVSGTGVDTAAIRTLLANMIPPGMEIDVQRHAADAMTAALRTSQIFNGTPRITEAVDFRRADIIAWNKAVDREKAEKKARNAGARHERKAK